MGTRPHILIFNPDQWRGDVLGHLGNSAAQTPHLDNLVATDAISFRNSFVQAKVCTPSRCSFMTGWYPHVRGHRTMHYMLVGLIYVVWEIGSVEIFVAMWEGVAVYVPMILYMNLTYLPESARPGWINIVFMVLASAMYIGFAGYTFYSKVVEVLAG